jgi:hypothetical protein
MLHTRENGSLNEAAVQGVTYTNPIEATLFWTSVAMEPSP